MIALLPVCSFAGQKGKAVPKEKILTLISEYRGQDGFDVVRLGPLGTTLARSVAKIALKVDGDDETAEILKLVNGIRSIAVVDYEDCASSVKDSFNAKLGRILNGTDLLMEVKDDEDHVFIYGVVDEAGDKVQNFVLHVPADCALICMFGTISMDTVAKIAELDM